MLSVCGGALVPTNQLLWELEFDFWSVGQHQVE